MAGSPGKREKDSATWEWPISAMRWGCTSKHSSACSGESTYSQTGSRGLAWYSPTASSRLEGSSAVQVGAGLGGDRLLGPGRGQRGAAGELLQRQGSADPEIVVAGQADRRVLAGEVDAGVGIGAVADQVAEAPQLLAVRVALIGLEHRLEGVAVAVDVGDDRDLASLQSLR